MVAEGALIPLMALCMSADSTVTILSLTTLGIILESPVNVASFFEASISLFVVEQFVLNEQIIRRAPHHGFVASGLLCENHFTLEFQEWSPSDFQIDKIR